MRMYLLCGEDILTLPEKISYFAGEDILLGRRRYTYFAEKIYFFICYVIGFQASLMFCAHLARALGKHGCLERLSTNGNDLRKLNVTNARVEY